MKKNALIDPNNVTFDDLVAICKRHCGEPRIRGSHFIFTTPWNGDPRINLQKDGNMVKSYQVRDVIKAIKKLEVQHGK